MLHGGCMHIRQPCWPLIAHREYNICQLSSISLKLQAHGVYLVLLGTFGVLIHTRQDIAM